MVEKDIIFAAEHLTGERYPEAIQVAALQVLASMVMASAIQDLVRALKEVK